LKSIDQKKQQAKLAKVRRDYFNSLQPKPTGKLPIAKRHKPCQDDSMMKKLGLAIWFGFTAAVYAVPVATNAPVVGPDLDSTQQFIQSLPPTWQHYAMGAVLLLMILGRVGTSAMTSGGVVPILKSVFMGSVHTQDPVPTTTVVVPAPASKPVPASIVVKSNP